MSSHVVSTRVYFAVFAALMVLTVLTVLTATHDFGALNTPIALAIAVSKASLVVWFFMHAKFADNLTKVWIVAGVFFLGLMLLLTGIDYFSRNW
jgi:cytochrome c oxidase subunit IV